MKAVQLTEIAKPLEARDVSMPAMAELPRNVCRARMTDSSSSSSAASSSLWNRLSQHRGSARTGGGNHRGSIFRLLVGAALLETVEDACATWGQGSSAPREVREGEAVVERQVSATLGQFGVLHVAVNDPPGPSSQRGIIAADRLIEQFHRRFPEI